MGIIGTKMDKKSTTRKQFIKLAVLVVIVLAVIAVFGYTPLEITDFTPVNVKDFILGFGFYAPVVFLTIYVLRSVILVMPVFVVSLTSGLAFGPFWGWLLNVTGATIGACASFLVSRFFGRGFIEMIPFFKAGPIEEFENKLAERSFKYLFLMRLVGIPPFDVVNFGSGLTKVNFRDYVLASFLGMLPGGFITTFLGSSLENWKSPKFLIALAAFILLMFVPYLYKKFKKKGVEKAP